MPGFKTPTYDDENNVMFCCSCRGQDVIGIRR